MEEELRAYAGHDAERLALGDRRVAGGEDVEPVGRPVEIGGLDRHQLDRPRRQGNVRLEVAHREEGITETGEQPDDVGRRQPGAPVDIGAVHFEDDVGAVLAQHPLAALEHRKLRALQIEHDEADAGDSRRAGVEVHRRGREAGRRRYRRRERVMPLKDEAGVRVAPQSEGVDAQVVEIVQLRVAREHSGLVGIRLEGMAQAAAPQRVRQRNGLVAEIGPADDCMVDPRREVEQQPGRLRLPHVVGRFGHRQDEVARDLRAIGEFDDQSGAERLADHRHPPVQRVRDRTGHLVADAAEAVLGPPLERLERGDDRRPCAVIAADGLQCLFGRHISRTPFSISAGRA